MINDKFFPFNTSEDSLLKIRISGDNKQLVF